MDRAFRTLPLPDIPRRGPEQGGLGARGQVTAASQALSGRVPAPPGDEHRWRSRGAWDLKL